ncbi:hypothetical protein AgCh_023240 [Apium graveolens]
MTITLEDVYMNLGLPITGRAVTHMELDNPKPYWVTNWEDLRMTEKERAEMYGRGGVTLHKLCTRYGSRPEGEQSPEFLQQDPIVYTRAYLLFLIGGILFSTSSRDVVHPRYLQLIQDTDHIIDYAWGAAVLSYLYRCLSKAVHKSSGSLNGCAMLLMLWAWERVLPGRPEIAPRTRFVLPRATAWARPVANRRSNPHHHTGGYRGDFDSFQMSWLTWQPYRRFYRRIDYSADDYDTDMMDMLHTALGRIPMIHFEMVEYVMPDRVLRQFGMLQHIPEEPVDHGFLRVERLSQGAYVPMTEYMYWYRRVSKLKIAPFVAEHATKIRPRDWYNQQNMVDAAETSDAQSSEDPLHVSQKRLRQKHYHENFAIADLLKPSLAQIFRRVYIVHGMTTDQLRKRQQRGYKLRINSLNSLWTRRVERTQIAGELKIVT